MFKNKKRRILDYSLKKNIATLRIYFDRLQFEVQLVFYKNKNTLAMTSSMRKEHVTFPFFFPNIFHIWGIICFLKETDIRRGFRQPIEKSLPSIKSATSTSI